MVKQSGKKVDMQGYTKLFGTLIGSSLWRSETKETKIIWITMLAMANRDGIVETSLPGLADFAKVSREECVEALERLGMPDEDSRTPDNEGRRIEPVEGGWRILNHGKYRDKLNYEERKMYLAQKQAEWRAKQAGKKSEAEMSVAGKESVNHRFEKPSMEELALHAAKIGLSIEEVDKFYNYYESNGWRVGRNPMKSWSHALVNWKNNLQTYGNKKHGKSNGERFDHSVGTANEGIAGRYKGLGKVAK